MSPRPLRNRVTWIALMCVVTFGCSPLPTAPGLPAREVAGRPSGSGVTSPLLEPDPSPGIVDPDTLVHVEPVDGDRGGSVKLHLVEVEVPSGAYSGGAEIRVSIPDSTRLEAHLDIVPASKNSFTEPVKLTFDLSATLGPQDQKVYWFDEALGTWVLIPSEYDSARKTLMTRLPHFSMYKVAKASWAKASWGIAP